MDEDNRPPESLRRQYEVERELHRRLMNSTRAGRPQLFGQLYQELFARVPDHPRLTRRDTAESSRQAVAARMKLLRPHLAGVNTFMEIAPGDCHLACEVCRHVGNVIALDISDQSGGHSERPANFQLVIYDGYTLGLPENSVDLAFSYQFLEHVHPEDTEGHFQTMRRVLKPGGVYIFDTPHRFSGPHDASFCFADEAEGMHLKEWTYRELGALAQRVGFARWFSFRFGTLRASRLANALTLGLESAVGGLPIRLRRRLSQRLFKGVTMWVQK